MSSGSNLFRVFLVDSGSNSGPGPFPSASSLLRRRKDGRSGKQNKKDTKQRTRNKTPERHRPLGPNRTIR